MLLQANKRLTYATRRLQPGDQFDAAERHGRLLVALGMAEEAAAAPKSAFDKIAEGLTEAIAIAKAAPFDANEEENSWDALLLEAASIGMKVDKRWGAKRLAAEIEQARKT